MNIMKALLLSGGMLMPVAASALPFGLTQEEVDRGAMSILSDRPVSAKALRKGEDGAIRLYDVTLRGADKTITTEYLVLRPEGAVETGPGRLKMTEEGKGTLSFSASEFSSAELAERHLDAVVCDVMDRESNLTALGTVTYSDLVMRTDIGIDVAEQDDSRMSRAEMTMVGNPSGSGCLYPGEVLIRDMEIRSADGARAEIDEVDFSIGLFGPEGSDLVVEGALTGMVALQPDGAVIGTADLIRMRGAVSPGLFEELTRITELKGSPDFTKELASVLRKEHFGMRHEVSGARVNVGVLLGEGLARRIGIDPASQMDIQSSFLTSLDRGTIDLEIGNDMSGLTKGLLKASFIVAPPSSSAGLAIIADAVPGIEVMSLLRLANLELDVSDMGIQDAVRSATGNEPADIAKAKLAGIRHLPEDIRTAIAGWIDQAAKDGRGRVVMDPIEPVGLVDIGMAAMMNPKGLGNMLDIDTSLTE